MCACMFMPTIPNYHCIKRLISIRIITLLISKVIIITMCTLLNTIKASMHTCFEFNYLIAFKFYY